MPPNYGIVDHIAFYHSDVVEGPWPQAIGEVVDCEAIPNVDGGKYEWRLIKVVLSRSGRVRHPYVIPSPCRSRLRCEMLHSYPSTQMPSQACGRRYHHNTKLEEVLCSS